MKGVTSSKSGGGGASKKDKKEHQQTGTSDKSGGNVGQRQRDERQEQSQADHELFLQAFESKRLCTYSTHSYQDKRMHITYLMPFVNSIYTGNSHIMLYVHRSFYRFTPLMDWLD